MTKSLMSFAIPNFIVLVKAAAAQLDLPTPFDMEKKLYLTTLGTGVCTTYLVSVDLALEEYRGMVLLDVRAVPCSSARFGPGSVN